MPSSPDAERADRLADLVAESHSILDNAVQTEVLEGDRELAATVILFSGGNDSTVLAHLFKGRADYAAHCNTGIGIEQTRDFVRDTCDAWGLPLLERHPPAGSTYRDLVLDQGFPGPAMHYKMFQRLKERALEQIRRELVPHPYRQRVVFLAGRRRDESQRRKDIPAVERKGSTVWVSPLVSWSKLDLNYYRATYDVPRNEVADLLHMSGECLCGAFAKPGELDEIGYWFPDVRAEIERLEAEVTATGKHPEARCRWGWGPTRPAAERASRTGPLCSSCDVALPGFEEAAPYALTPPRR